MTFELPQRLGDEPRFGVGPAVAQVCRSSRPWQLLCVSGRSASALDEATDALAAFLRVQPSATLADVAYTLHRFSAGHAHRRFAVCRDIDDAVAAFSRRDPARLLSGVCANPRRPVAFLFSGLGDQYVGMGRGLYESEPVFRVELERCATLLLPLIGYDVRELIFAEEQGAADGSNPGGPDLRGMICGHEWPQSEAEQRLQATRLAQPALFALELALARLWMSWGIRPEAVAGYSLGEYAAAVLAGVHSMGDAARLVAERASLIETCEPGAMLAVALPEEEARGALIDGVDVAAVNGPHLCVLSGRREAVAAIQASLAGKGVACRPLSAQQAFHSAMMVSITGPLTDLARAFAARPPTLPLLSNVTGTWITDEEAVDPAYWSRHLRGTVRFGDAVGALWECPERVLLEVGPGQGLCSLAMHYAAAHGLRDRLALHTLRSRHDGQADEAVLLTSLGRLWLAGAVIDWDGFYAHEQRCAVALPGAVTQSSGYGPAPRDRVRAAPVRAAEEGRTGVRARAVLPNPYVAPQSDTERALVAIWEEVLGVAGVGAHDNFFELGGQSLMGAQVIARLRARFRVDLRLGALFAAPTVVSLALAVEEMLLAEVEALSDEEVERLANDAAGEGAP